jgi:hypothetical protein
LDEWEPIERGGRWKKGIRSAPYRQGDGGPLTYKATRELLLFRSSKCESSVVGAPLTVVEQTPRAFEKIVSHEISTVVAVVSGRIRLPISVAADFERNRSDASLRLAFQEGCLGEQRALTVLPFLHTEVAKFILATTSTKMLASFVP